MDLLPIGPAIADVRAPQYGVQDLVQEVALNALKELAVSLALTGIACFFIATPAGIALTLATSAGFTLFNALLKAAQLYLEHSAKNDPSLEQFYNFISPVFTLARGIVFAFASFSFATLIHEGGHFLAIKFFSPDINPTVEIFPDGGGVTTWRGTISNQSARAVISFAGAGAAIAVSLIALIAAHKAKDSHPRLSGHLNGWAAANILHSSLYALDAWTTPVNALRGHDFVALANYGLNPLALAIGMIAVPLLIKGAMMVADHYRQRSLPLQV
jgi:hypothetical protein